MKKFLQRKMIFSLWTLVLFLLSFTQLLCMESEELKNSNTPKVMLSLQGDENILSALAILKNVKVANEENLPQVKQSIEKIEEALIKKEKKIKELKEERKKLYSLTAKSDLRIESCVNLKEDMVTSPVSYLSFDEWRKAISTKTAFWAEILIKKCTSQTLTDLNFSSNCIRSEGVHALCTGNFHSLTQMDLSDNFIEDEGIKAFYRYDLHLLTRLHLKNNYITDEGVVTLVSSNLPFLRSLNLEQNYITNKGAIVLSSCKLSYITSLYLVNNLIKEEGATTLVNKNKLTALQTLNLQSNQIHYGVHNELKKSAEKNKIQNFYL